MKSVWNVVTFLAMVHLLALLMFVGWLWQSNRLNGERVNAIRQILALTVTEAEIAAQAAKEEADAAYEESMAEHRRLHPPVPSEMRITQIRSLEEIENRTFRRIEQEKAMLREQIATAQARLDEREASFEAMRTNWLETVEAERLRRTDEQFSKTVRQYESARPRQGKDMIMELIAAGEMQQAVAYLDAMNVRAASRILGEFKSEAEIGLATELLEQLRTFGVPDVDSQQAPEPSDARNVADAR